MKLLKLIDKKRIFILPLPIAELTASFFQIMPKPIITRDQLRLLKYDNVLSGKYKSILKLVCLQKDILMKK